MSSVAIPGVIRDIPVVSHQKTNKEQPNMATRQKHAKTQISSSSGSGNRSPKGNWAS